WTKSTNNSTTTTTTSTTKRKPSSSIELADIQLSRSPITFSSGPEDNGSTDEDIFKLSKDLTNTFGVLHGDGDTPPPFSDVIFRVKDRRFFASKIMLVSRSEYFKAMFTHSMKESTVKEVTLEGVEPDVFYVVLRYICIGILDLDFDIRIIGSIYNYCDLLGLMRGKELALGIMTRCAISYMQAPDVENALLLWDAANAIMIPVESIHPQMRAFIIQYAAIFMYSDIFPSISEKTVCDMLRNDGLRMEELDILECIVDWCRANSTDSTGAPLPKDPASGTGSQSKRSSMYQRRGVHDDNESTGSCSSSRCSSRRGSIHERETAGDPNRTDSHNDTDGSYSGSDLEDESDYDDDFTDDDDKEDSANDDYFYSTEPISESQEEELDESIDRNLLNNLLPLIRWENMNIGEAFERLDCLKIIPEKEITNLLRGIIRANRGEPFQFLGYHYRRPRNTRKRTYPLEFLLGISQPFNSPQSNELMPLNPICQEFGQTSCQFLYRIKKNIKLPCNLERFTFKDRDFFVQLKEREKGQLAVYLAFGQKLTKPLAVGVSATIIGFRFQDNIEFTYKKMFDEGFDSAWGWPRFISLEALQKDKYTHYGDSFVLLLDLTSQWG
ncbi:hypothetical protein SAMD00019534_039240, partial [Acytostelium subglobosum LB1]|uniref:hypothetical protein n=1 Tax=Acytostelium subglobosum LB1 TaxID=1410327 RepID=UPI000644DA01